MNIVILAAGKGTRMRSDLPKVLHPLAELPLLGHVLNTATELHPAQLVVVVGHGAAQVQQRFAQPSPAGRPGRVSRRNPAAGIPRTNPDAQWQRGRNAQ